MTWVSLQMVSLGSFLILTGCSSSSAAAGGSRCVGHEELRHRADRIQRKYMEKLPHKASAAPDNRTCARTATQLHPGLEHRSLSPWIYRLDVDDDRVPHKIPVAKCLCEGCIINRREDLDYNSVLVFTSLMVLRKTRCPSDPSKHVLKKDFIRVPVACTCALPKYGK